MKMLTSQFQQVRVAQLFSASFLILSFVGCSGKDIRVYEVAKETVAGNSHQHTAPAVSDATSPRLTWALPAGWEEAPTGELRLASFKIKDENGKQADVSVITLSGTAGGDANNVNRWRGQVSLPPVYADELAKLAEKVDVGGSEGALFDLNGTAASGDATRILVTILHREDGVWFFKATGDETLLARQKPAFVAFLKSLKFGEPADSPAALPAGHPRVGEVASAFPQGHPPVAETTSALPQGHPPIGDGKPAAGLGTKSSPSRQWNVPTGWKEEMATQMLIAKFSVGDKSARAEITVSSFPGDVGGLLANVNRWRGQVGLLAIEATELAKAVKYLKVQSVNASLVELENPNGTSPSLIGVAMPSNGQTWFFKIIGEAKTVAREKDAFIKFVQSVKLPNAT